MTAFDYIVLAIVGVSVLVSLFRGAVREVMSIASWVASFLIALNFAPTLAKFLPVSLGQSWLRLFVAFGVLMIVGLLLFGLVAFMLTRLIRGSGLSPLDRSLGVLFGLVRALVILVALMLIAGLTPLPREPGLAQRNIAASAGGARQECSRVSAPACGAAHPLLVRPFNYTSAGVSRAAP